MLTARQNEAYETFSEWLRDKGNLTAKLKGYAGTGKTFLLQYVIKEAKTIMVTKYNTKLEEYVTEPFSICVTAPTHQAKKVIQKVTKAQGRTIQSILGLAPNTDIENFDINNPAFEVKNTPAMPNFDLVIIDEAYMLPSGILDIIFKTATEYGVKVLFVFDAAQLSPIGEDTGPVDTAPDILISEELTEVIRTDSSNPILATYTSIRKNLMTSRDSFSHTTRISEDKTCGEVYIKDKSVFEVRVVKRFWNRFQENKVNTDKVLAWTNKAVNKWNNLIRNSIKGALKLNDPMSEFFFKGEPLISYSTIKDSIIINSEEYFLEDPEFTTKVWEYYERDEKGQVIDPTKPKTVEIQYITGSLCLIDMPEASEIVSFVVPTKENYSKFVTAFYWFHSLGIIDRRWPQFFSWKDQNLLLKDLTTSKGRVMCKKDFDYSYAVSLHKSQGSTYTNVYIDEPDIDQLEDTNFVKFLYDSDLAKCKNKFQKIKFMKDYPNFEVFYNKTQVLKNRLKYVGMTRPTNFMVMYTRK